LSITEGAVRKCLPHRPSSDVLRYRQKHWYANGDEKVDEYSGHGQEEHGPYTHEEHDEDATTYWT
jgi:hypothetical protein